MKVTDLQAYIAQCAARGVALGFDIEKGGVILRMWRPCHMEASHVMTWEELNLAIVPLLDLTINQMLKIVLDPPMLTAQRAASEFHTGGYLDISKIESAESNGEAVVPLGYGLAGQKRD
jgi:hypothetical protein